MNDDTTHERTTDDPSTGSARPPTRTAAAGREYADPWRFFVIALGVSYLFWLPLIAFEYDPFSIPGVVPFAAGALGVPGAAIYLLFRSADEEHRQDYWRRLVDVRRIGLRWYVVAFLLYPALNVLALTAGVLAGDSIPAFERAADLAADPASIVSYVLFVLVFGPLPEELGWRGYALDGLQARSSALRASLILGAVWAVWHVPLFMMEGTYQAGLGVLTRQFWQFMAGILVVSILYTWIYNHTGRSILAAILFHFSGNFSGELVAHGELGSDFSFVLALVVAVVVVFVYGPETLTRRSRRQSSGAD
ncbi:type II CAAX endopeptidase family protein [Natronoglomus mannanivorans]|uniref:CPBP family intramembrane metalloprotease n=1 Tax=Natronoglomus mannanivorans TaxID=2979990 RepID=A0AAP2Z411_9EURY|nr:CPBP family intramembrane metalloprotease [Halobacteria archaeon AArc-xg1-1]